MQRRRYLAVVGAALVAGCGGSDGGATPTVTAAGDETDTMGDGQTRTATATGTSTPTPEPSIQVKIDYADDWDATLQVTAGGGMESRTLSDSGPETYDVDPTASVVSVSAKKEDSTVRTLTVQIIRNGEVVAEGSTDDDFGTIDVQQRFEQPEEAETATRTRTPTETETATDVPADSIEVIVDYPDNWSATLEVTTGGGMGSRSLSDSGQETYEVDPTASLVSVEAQKEDSTARTLTVQIIRDGEVVAEGSTDDDFGTVEVQHRF